MYDYTYFSCESDGTYDTGGGYTMYDYTYFSCESDGTYDTDCERHAPEDSYQPVNGWEYEAEHSLTGE